MKPNKKEDGTKKTATAQSEFHPADKTGMAFREETPSGGFTDIDETGEDNYAATQRGKKTKKQPQFETSTQAEQGVMDKRKNEEY